MKFRLRDYDRDDCPPGYDETIKKLDLDREYTTEEAIAAGLDPGQSIGALISYARRDKVALARLRQWAERCATDAEIDIQARLSTVEDCLALGVKAALAMRHSGRMTSKEEVRAWQYKRLFEIFKD